MKKKFLLTVDVELMKKVIEMAEKLDRSINKTINILIEKGLNEKTNKNER